MDFFNTSFYDKASTEYSEKRYKGVIQSFIQFCFQRRLKHILSIIRKYSMRSKNLILIEDGCADGIVAQEINKANPNVFSRIIGTDISPKMIERAKEINIDLKLSFYLKDELDPYTRADFVLAVGFVSPGIFKDEFTFIMNHLAEDGIIIVSLVSSNSPYAKLKLFDKEIIQDYWNFKEYKGFLEERFEVIEAIPYGLFVPKLWALPTIARVLQPLFETILGIFPVLFHETLYVLKEKR